MKEKSHIPEYKGYRTKFMRLGRSRHEGDRVTKRARLGGRLDRALYKSCKAHLTSPTRYAQLCAKACQMVYKRDMARDLASYTREPTNEG